MSKKASSSSSSQGEVSANAAVRQHYNTEVSSANSLSKQMLQLIAVNTSKTSILHRLIEDSLRAYPKDAHLRIVKMLKERGCSVDEVHRFQTAWTEVVVNNEAFGKGTKKSSTTTTLTQQEPVLPPAQFAQELMEVMYKSMVSVDDIATALQRLDVINEQIDQIYATDIREKQAYEEYLQEEQERIDGKRMRTIEDVNPIERRRSFDLQREVRRSQLNAFQQELTQLAKQIHSLHTDIFSFPSDFFPTRFAKYYLGGIPQVTEVEREAMEDEEKNVEDGPSDESMAEKVQDVLYHAKLELNYAQKYGYDEMFREYLPLWCNRLADVSFVLGTMNIAIRNYKSLPPFFSTEKVIGVSVENDLSTATEEAWTTYAALTRLLCCGHWNVFPKVVEVDHPDDFYATVFAFEKPDCITFGNALKAVELPLLLRRFPSVVKSWTRQMAVSCRALSITDYRLLSPLHVLYNTFLTNDGLLLIGQMQFHEYLQEDEAEFFAAPGTGKFHIRDEEDVYRRGAAYRNRPHREGNRFRQTMSELRTAAGFPTYRNEEERLEQIDDEIEEAKIDIIVDEKEREKRRKAFYQSKQQRQQAKSTKLTKKLTYSYNQCGFIPWMYDVLMKALATSRQEVLLLSSVASFDRLGYCFVFPKYVFDDLGFAIRDQSTDTTAHEEEEAATERKKSATLKGKTALNKKGTSNTPTAMPKTNPMLKMQQDVYCPYQTYQIMAGSKLSLELYCGDIYEMKIHEAQNVYTNTEAIFNLQEDEEDREENAKKTSRFNNQMNPDQDYHILHVVYKVEELGTFMSNTVYADSNNHDASKINSKPKVEGHVITNERYDINNYYAPAASMIFHEGMLSATPFLDLNQDPDNLQDNFNALLDISCEIPCIIYVEFSIFLVDRKDLSQSIRKTGAIRLHVLPNQAADSIEVLELIGYLEAYQAKKIPATIFNTHLFTTAREVWKNEEKTKELLVETCADWGKMKKKMQLK